MAFELDFSDAEKKRVELTEEQQKQIQDLYEQVSKDIAKRASKAPRVPSDALRKAYLDELQKQVNAEINNLRFSIESLVEGSMGKVAESVVGSNIDFLKEIGLPVEGAMSHVPSRIVERVAAGRIYAGDWSLSRQLWKQSVHTQKDINTVIAKGIAENKSAYDIAKDLEKYVDPKARKDWEWSKAYPGTSKKVDYNAQRLARTMVSHAYQQAFVETTRPNPFVTKYQWEASNSERVCEVCAERDGQLYDKDDLPLDHPNGMCTFVAVMEDSMEQIADRLAAWANGSEDAALDKYAESLYGKDWINQKAEIKPQSVFEHISSMTKSKDIIKELDDSGWFTHKFHQKDIDPEILKHITSAYQRIFERYPALQGKFPPPFVGTTMNSKAYASCGTIADGQITLNRSKWNSWDSITAAYNKDVKMGFHPEGTSAESLLIHEFGHAIDGYLARSKLVQTDTDYSSSVLLEKAFADSGMSTSAVGWKVSSYAKKNDRECFAECFAQGMESKEPCSLTKELMAELDKLLGGK